MKRFFRAFLGNTPLLLLFLFPSMTGLMVLDFLIRFYGKHPVSPAMGQVGRLIWANLPWIFSITFLITVAYGLILSTSAKDLSGPGARESHVRRWLLLSLLAVPAYFWHLEVVVPEGNHQARRVRALILRDGDTTSFNPRRSDRELGVGRMLDERRTIPSKIDSIRQSEASPERKERLIAYLRNWSDRLAWEIAKKFQMTLLIPATAALALAAGLLLKAVRKGWLRLSFAVALAKAYIVAIFRGLGLIEKHIDAQGFSAFAAWAPFACLALAALAAGYRLLRRVDGSVSTYV